MPARKWVGTTALAEELGVSNKFLWNNRLKLFEAKKHWRVKNPLAFKPTYSWHLERCKKLWDDAAKAAAAKEQSQSVKPKGRGLQLPLVDGVKPYEID